jgi:DNA (cytosine-5)-methyltransferase 1
MNRPLALDLFCCAGGAAVGLHRAGYDVVGVDIDPQPHYPFPFIQADVTQLDFRRFALVWASPPCQQFCRLRTREDLSGYPDLIEPVRAKLIASGAPYVIENVPEAPIRKDLMLCGGMFGLRSYRHRHFVNRRGENRREHWANGGFITITGDIGVYCGPEAMGIDWMSGNEMSEAIPPAYSEYIGRAALAASRPRLVEAAE